MINVEKDIHEKHKEENQFKFKLIKSNCLYINIFSPK